MGLISAECFYVPTSKWRYKLAAQNYFDLNAVFRFMETHDVVIGVNNVFDEEPPLAGQSLSWNGNTFAGLYDTLGRYLFANVTLRW